MDSESKSRDRKSFDKASEGAKKPNYLLQLPRSGNRQALDDLFASSSSGFPPGVASYLDAHLAWTCSAMNRPSVPGRPSISACELSTNVSGKGSLPT